MLSKIELTNFKSHQAAIFEFDSLATAIVGPNASGKTNILEAIYFSFLTKSFRSAKADMISYGEPFAKVSTDFKDGKKHHTIEHRIRRAGESANTSIKLNRVVKKPAEVVGSQPVVVFVPEDIRIITDGPQFRRSFINNIIVQSSPQYLDSLSRFQKILNQRNRLLYKIKHYGRGDRDQIFVYNLQLSEPIETIYRYRQSLVDHLSQELSRSYSAISAKNDKIEIEYLATLPYGRNDILTALEKSTDYDLATGFSSLGPHKDELAIKLNGQNSRDGLSRGEGRTLTLALKTLELEYIKNNTSKSPILLLDDVLSELDPKRQDMLLQSARQNQMIITTTHLANNISSMKVIQL